MEIREIRKEDINSYWDLRLNALKEFPTYFGSSYEESLLYTHEQVLNRINNSDKQFMLGAFINNNLVGMVAFTREERKKVKHKGTISGMYVSNEYQKQGIGKKLLLEIINRCKKLEGLEQLILYVASSNEFAKKLYLNVGFQVYGVEKNALKIDNQYYDEDLMVLFL